MSISYFRPVCDILHPRNQTQGLCTDLQDMAWLRLVHLSDPSPHSLVSSPAGLGFLEHLILVPASGPCCLFLPPGTFPWTLCHPRVVLRSQSKCPLSGLLWPSYQEPCIWYFISSRHSSYLKLFGSSPGFLACCWILTRVCSHATGQTEALWVLSLLLLWNLVQFLSPIICLYTQ